MSELGDLEEINLIADRTGKSAIADRAKQKAWSKFVASSRQRPLWKKQLAGSHAGHAKFRNRNK